MLAVNLTLVRQRLSYHIPKILNAIHFIRISSGSDFVVGIYKKVSKKVKKVKKERKKERERKKEKEL